VAKKTESRNGQRFLGLDRRGVKGEDLKNLIEKAEQD